MHFVTTFGSGNTFLCLCLFVHKPAMSWNHISSLDVKIFNRLLYLFLWHLTDDSFRPLDPMCIVMFCIKVLTLMLNC